MSLVCGRARRLGKPWRACQRTSPRSSGRAAAARSSTHRRVRPGKITLSGKVLHYVRTSKIAWGGKSLAKDFRPPSSGGEVGPYYKELFQHVRDVLGNLKKHFPEYDGRGHEIVGFGWHQGWNDRVNQAANDEYEKNMANFIRDVRKELAIEGLPFVIAETGMSGHKETHPRALSLMRAQAAVPKHEEFKGNVAFVGTKDFYRPPEVSPSGQSYHWNSNAETYFLIGHGMGKAMIELVHEKK
ncbi:MAG: hypothetical protein HQ567_15135 [Candidatus Nealsonbacteria bacterium]|nr:hypothetical protein [Candidatus Nealsonbacteria bacterium]